MSGRFGKLVNWQLMMNITMKKMKTTIMIIGGRPDEEDDEPDDDDNVDDDDIVGWWDAQLTEETLWLLARFFFCHQISHPLHLPPNIFIFSCQQIFHPFLGPNILSFTFDQILYCLWSTKNGSTKMYLKFASYILSLQDTATNAVNCASRLGAKRQLGERLVVVLSQSWDGYNDDDDDRWGWVVVWSQSDSQRRGSNFQTARWGLVGAGGVGAGICVFIFRFTMCSCLQFTQFVACFHVYAQS